MEENIEILKKLKQQGWYLTENGLKKIVNAEKPGGDLRKIIAAALNWDFREIAGGALPAKREDTIPGRIILQIQKIRNISAPKSNEESKAAQRLLQVDLSDGQLLLQGLELEPIPTLNLNVAPGTKVYLCAERLQLMQGFAVLRAMDVQVLGGRVDNLAEKWELARTMLKYARSGRRISGTLGPPPWIAFGKKLEIKDSVDTRNFKSLQAAAEKDKNGNKGNEGFNAMRTEAIAEAAKAGAKKVFGGGNQQIPDYNVKKILEKGYSEEDAKQALRSTNNNLERALYNLKRRDEHKRNDDKISSIEMAPANIKANRGGTPSSRETNGKRGSLNTKEEPTAAKPAANVSLFDFLTEKLPTNPENSAVKTESTKTLLSTNNHVSSNPKFTKSKSDVTKCSKALNAFPIPPSTRPKFENNISSSFTATRAVGGTRSTTRHERDSFKASERQTNSHGSSAGARGSNGRGKRGNKVSRDDESNHIIYREKRHDCQESGKKERISNTNNNNNPCNRSSVERTNTTNFPSTQNENDKSQQQKTISADNAYKSRRPQDRQHNKENDKTRHSSSYKSSNNRRYDDNSNHHQNNSDVPSNGHNNTNITTKSSIANEKAVNKLVESVTIMKINKTQENTRGRKQRPQNQRQQHQSQYHQQDPSEQQSVSGIAAQQYHQTPQLHQQMLPNQTQTNYSQQLANGFTYDPSKIIGFQNKETNEFAMTLLKSQGLALTTSSPTVQPTTASQISTGQFMPSLVTQIQIPSQHTQSPFGKPAAFVLPTVQNAPPPQISPVGTGYAGPIQRCDNWAWKIGDLCMAKYWDDGIYYEAEITGISDKTCVVFFRGYGNHEEVLQTDCVPITDANHRPINQFNVNEQRQHMLAPMVVPNVLHGNATQNRGIPNRHRGERQVYVPPPKREN